MAHDCRRDEPPRRVLIRIPNVRTVVIAHDLVMIALAWLLALSARFNFGVPPPDHLHGALRALPAVLLVQGAIAWYFRLYRGLWRFASLQDLWNIVRSAALGALAVTLALFVVMRLEAIPRSVLILYPLFLIFLLGGPRLLYRLAKDRSLTLHNIRNGERVLIVGAGSSGEMLLRDILRDGNYVPVGLLDDRAGLIRMRIHGVPVLGSIERLPELAQRYHADRVFIAVPSATNAQMQRIVGFCERAGVPFRTLPRLQDLVSGRIGLREVREVAIDDLLGRSAVQLDWDGIQRQLLGKTVLVTGGGGSIGAELCRQVARLGVAKLVLYERGEYPLYRIERELRRNFPHLALDAMLGDVCDAIALEHAFAAHRPHLVFHAAAYKHVPIVEAQIREGVRNNVLGTQNVVDAADRHGCEAMVLISTDKAVRPSSAMGATKRFAEMLCERRNLQSATRYVTVRFGNVLDSAGSVVPLFREQIRDGGPVTVTHPEATRYFMTIPEACQLILQAAAVGTGGDIFVLDMGDPVNITYLAEQMIRLSGRSPGQDIRIVYTGLRPGEKLREELFHADENLRQTPHPKLLLAGQTRLETTRIDRLYERLLQACDAFDEKELRELLTEAVPELSSGARSAVHDPRVVRFKRQQS